MSIMGAGLVRSLQPWDVLLIYCNNQLRRYTAALLRLAGDTLCPLLRSLSEAFSALFHFNKLCHTKALEWSSLVPGPKAKSSWEIMDLTRFTVHYHICMAESFCSPPETNIALLIGYLLQYKSKHFLKICMWNGKMDSVNWLQIV